MVDNEQLVQDEDDEMNFYEGKVFVDIYPPEAAGWCNENGHYIEEIEKTEDGDRQFIIRKVPEPSIEEIRSHKLQELHNKFDAWYNGEAVVCSSLGFTADSDSRAKADVDGLIEVMECTGGDASLFRDADNELHQLTLADLKTLRIEIIQNGQFAYQTKWTLEAQINGAETRDEIDAIEVTFVPLQFEVPMPEPEVPEVEEPTEEPVEGEEPKGDEVEPQEPEVEVEVEDEEVTTEEPTETEEPVEEPSEEELEGEVEEEVEPQEQPEVPSEKTE